MASKYLDEWMYLPIWAHSCLASRLLPIERRWPLARPARAPPLTPGQLPALIAAWTQLLITSIRWPCQGSGIRLFVR
jgi:hypothetical protein